MTDICLVFMVHQPFRLNRSFTKDLFQLGRLTDRLRLEKYFDEGLNRDVFERAAEKCYLRANEVFLAAVEKHRHEKRRVEVSYSLSGTFVEQCERYRPDVLEGFRRLAETGCVEFVGQTYYHTLASLFSATRDEFAEQVRMHRELVRSVFKYDARTFENTELLYNNSIAATVEGLGYKTMLIEGTARALGYRSPNHVYRAKGLDLKLLPRNYQLSDDIGFRFTSRSWEGWPLSADKYAAWLSGTHGESVNLYLDYETFGEHMWPESGIHDFLRVLPEEILRHPNLSFAAPSRSASSRPPVGEVDVGDYETTSWADLERDTSAWLGNSLQRNAYERVRALEPFVREAGSRELLALWRYLQVSDHFHHMSTKIGGAGDVHSYFSPFGSALEAYTAYSAVLADFEHRVAEILTTPAKLAQRKLQPVPEGKAFRFSQGFAKPTGINAVSLAELSAKLSLVPLNCIEFHTRRGDFERWVRDVLLDDELANNLHEIRAGRSKGPELRDALQAAFDAEIGRLSKAAAEAGG